MMDYDYCKNCKVAKWIYEMNGDIICSDDCPYRDKGEQK